ncbi:MAG: hypothetical protein Q8M34_10940 [Thermodesulfovibrionales bacterium]|nr:hypothetical protein [Thermodesulfovibrionales bacterium]
MLELMLTDDEIGHAGRYVEELRLSVHELDVPSNSRTRAAGSCFAIAQEHHHAIVLLIEWKLFAAAFALIRIEFEAYVRGEWLSQCASDSLVEAFLQGKEPPKIDCLLAELEMLDTFKERVLSQIKQKTWKSMCAYTHTGGLHVQRWNTEDGIEANYSRDEVLEVLKFAEIIASLAVVGVAHLAADDELAVRILEAFKRRVQA